MVLEIDEYWAKEFNLIGGTCGATEGGHKHRTYLNAWLFCIEGFDAIQVALWAACLVTVCWIIQDKLSCYCTVAAT